MANIVVYREYPIKPSERDPILDGVQEVLEKEGLSKKPKVVAELTNISRGTLYNWASGKTRFPRFATVAALYGALGYHIGFDRKSRFNLETELAEAKRWNSRRLAAKEAVKTRKNNNKRKEREDRTSL